MKNNLALVVCNYNKKDYLLECIQSIFASGFLNFDLIVVDNASTDGSAEAVNAQFGDKITLLVNEENLGGAGGFNRGMKYAMDRNYKYIQLVDNDVVFDKAAIGELYRYMEANPGVGACVPLVCYYTDPECGAELGGIIDIDNIEPVGLYKHVRIGKFPVSVECDYATACASMFRVETLKKSGIMNPIYFIGWDDIELGIMIRLAGYSIIAISAAKVLHHYEYNTGLTSTTLTRYYRIRNKIHYFTKFLNDEEFAVFPEKITERVFRSIAVSRYQETEAAAYIHGLNDGLDNVMGKAADGKVLPCPAQVEKLYSLAAGKENILIRSADKFTNLTNVLHNIIKMNPTVSLTILTKKEKLDDFFNIRVIKKCCDISSYDLIVNACYHILDESEYDRNSVYVDNYLNVIIDSNDFDYYEELDKMYSFFYCIFYEYIKSKLLILRKQIKHSKLG